MVLTLPIICQKQLTISLLIVLLSGCSKTSEIIKINDQKPELILQKELANIFGFKIYSNDLVCGNTFFKIQLPGYSLSGEDLSFAELSGDQFLSNPTVIDKAYLFSKRVNRIYSLGNRPEEIGVDLDAYCTHDYDDNKSGFPNLLSDSYLHKLTSARFNDEFYFTYPENISLEGREYISLRIKKYTHTSVEIEGSVEEILFPTYELNCSVKVVPVVRPWFRPKGFLNQGTCNRAYIIGLIVLKDIQLVRYEGYFKVKKRNGRRLKIKRGSIEPNLDLRKEGAIVIGHLYSII